MPFSPRYSSIDARPYSSALHATKTRPSDAPYQLTCQESRDYRTIDQWLEKLVRRVKKEDRSFQQLHPVIQEFQALIENDPELYRGFHDMFEQVPKKPPYHKDPSLKCQV
jgi:phosphatidylserine decarboxylase